LLLLIADLVAVASAPIGGQQIGQMDAYENGSLNPKR
jgi:hypothetical protein